MKDTTFYVFTIGLTSSLVLNHLTNDFMASSMANPGSVVLNTIWANPSENLPEPHSNVAYIVPCAIDLFHFV